MLPRSNRSQQGLTLLMHGSQHAFSKNPIFPLPPFFTHLKVQKRLWPVLWAFCPEVREGGWSRSPKELFPKGLGSGTPTLAQNGIWGIWAKLTHWLPNFGSALKQNPSLPSCSFVQPPTQVAAVSRDSSCSWTLRFGGLKKHEQNRET